MCSRPTASPEDCAWFTNMLTSYSADNSVLPASNRKSPVEDFLDALADRRARKVLWGFRVVEQLGIVPQQYFKKLTGTKELWEIRVQTGGARYRFLGFFDGPPLLVLTTAFVKKQQKTPLREIDLADQRRTDYLLRKTKP